MSHVGPKLALPTQSLAMEMTLVNEKLRKRAIKKIII